ncbi:MAG: sodium:calcium antiporter [Candidatus Thorarchaeota archaeon]
MNLELLFWILLFIIGYVIIYFFADYIIDLLEDLSEVYTISPVIIGMFILGVDLEESIVSLIAASNGFPYLSLGNLIGNTIIAVTIAFGLPALFLKFEFQQIPLFYYGLLLIGGISIMISMIVPQYLLLFALINLVLFVTYVIKSVKVQNKYREFLSIKESNDQVNAIIATDDDEGEEDRRLVIIFKVIFSLIVIFIGGETLVTSAEQLVLFTGLSETFFGLIIMAFVTNVEEFWLIVKSIQKGQAELGISAQIGKILWNTTLIFGICGVIIIQFEFKAIMVFSSIICFIILVLLVFNLVRKNLSTSTGVLYFAIFFLFVSLNIFFLL